MLTILVLFLMICTTIQSSEFGSEASGFVGIFGSEIEEGRTDDVNVQFQYGIPNYSTTTYTQGGGTVTSANSMAVLSTAASANSIAQLQSDQSLIYQSGHDAYAYFTAAFTGSFVATSSQLIGPYDYQNGFAVGFNGTTFGVLQRSNASNASVVVDTFVPQSSFNQDKLDGTGTSGFVYVPGNLNIFRISYGWLGSAIVKFQIMNSNGNWITFHIIQNPNASNIPSIGQPLLPITARVENLTGTSVLTLKTASWNAGTISISSDPGNRFFAVEVLANINTGTESVFMVLQNKSVFRNVPNKISVQIVQFAVQGYDKNGDVALQVKLYKNPTVSGAIFTDIDTNNSVMQVASNNQGITITGGTPVYLDVFNMDVGSASISGGPTGTYMPPNTYSVTLYPGDVIAFTMFQLKGPSSHTRTLSVAWVENF